MLLDFDKRAIKLCLNAFQWCHSECRLGRVESSEGRRQGHDLALLGLPQAALTWSIFLVAEKAKTNHRVIRLHEETGEGNIASKNEGQPKRTPKY